MLILIHQKVVFFSGDIYISFFGISNSFSSAFECNSFGDFAILVILLAILLQIKSPVASAIFLVAFNFFNLFLLHLLFIS